MLITKQTRISPELIHCCIDLIKKKLLELVITKCSVIIHESLTLQITDIQCYTRNFNKSQGSYYLCKA
jgi:hypothetical protein